MDRVVKFCYLTDMLSGGSGRVNSPSLTKVCYSWGKFIDLSKILTRNDLSLKLKEKMYVTFLRSVMVCRSETWIMNAEQII